MCEFLFPILDSTDMSLTTFFLQDNSFFLTWDGIHRYKNSRRRCSVKTFFFKILFFNKVVSFLLSLLLILPATLLKKMAQVLSCECCKIFKNIFLTEHLWATASPITESSTLYCCLNYLKIVIFLTATFLSEPFSSICLYNICF